MKIIKLPDIPEEDCTPIVKMLLKVIDQQHQGIEKLNSEVDELKAEIKRLKNHPKKPQIKPSKMEKGDGNGKPTGKRPGSAKKKRIQA